MARISNVLLVFSSQTVNSSGTITSDSFNLERSAFSGLHYILSTATTGPYVAATAQIFLTADPREAYLQPVDDAGNNVGAIGLINSNNRYIQNSIPHAQWGQVRIKSSTANAITFDAVYLVLDEHQ